MVQRITTDDFIDLMAHIDRGSDLITRQTFRQIENRDEEREFVLHELMFQKPEMALGLEQQFDDLDGIDRAAWSELR